MSILARAVTLLALMLLSLAPASAQNWPTRPIKIIVSQAAGGTPDLICRLISDKLSDLLGQRVVVENRPGGGNVVGAAAACETMILIGLLGQVSAWAGTNDISIKASSVAARANRDIFFSLQRGLRARFPNPIKNNDSMSGRATLIQVNGLGVRPDAAAFAG